MLYILARMYMNCTYVQKLTWPWRLWNTSSKVYFLVFEVTKLWDWKDGCICRASKTFATHPNQLLYIAEAWILHWHSFATQTQLSGTVHSSPFVSTEGWYYLIVDGLLPFNVEWCRLSWQNFTHSWSLVTSWFCYLFTSSKSTCLLDLTFLHVHYCIIGEGDCLGGKIHDRPELRVPKEYFCNHSGHHWLCCDSVLYWTHKMEQSL